LGGGGFGGRDGGLGGGEGGGTNVARMENWPMLP
jgi:hypothetical protein